MHGEQPSGTVGLTSLPLPSASSRPASQLIPQRDLSHWWHHDPIVNITAPLCIPCRPRVGVRVFRICVWLVGIADACGDPLESLQDLDGRIPCATGTRLRPEDRLMPGVRKPRSRLVMPATLLTPVMAKVHHSKSAEQLIASRPGDPGELRSCPKVAGEFPRSCVESCFGGRELAQVGPDLVDQGQKRRRRLAIAGHCLPKFGRICKSWTNADQDWEMLVEIGYSHAQCRPSNMRPELDDVGQRSRTIFRR